MRNRLASVLFWDRRLSTRRAGVFLAAILLAPLALAAAWWLELRIVSRIPARIAIDRAMAERAAHEFAASQGVDTSGWGATLSPRRDLGIYRYLLRNGRAGAEVLSAFQPWGSVRVRLRKKDGPGTVEVLLGVNGIIKGFRIDSIEFTAARNNLSQQEAVTLAERFLSEERKKHPFLSFSDPVHKSLASGKQGDPMIHTLKWKASVEGLPELTGSKTLLIDGNRIKEDSLELELTDSARASTIVAPGHRTVASMHDAFLVVLFFYILVRYVRRRAHGEVSRQRLYLLAFLTTASLVAMAWLSEDITPIQGQDLPVPFSVILIILLLLLIVAGLAAGAVYAGCEGDLRETYPHLLTSLDALLSGRLLSRNVGRSVVLGAVFLSWVLLIRNAVYIVAPPEFPRLEVIGDSIKFLFAPAPWLALLIRSQGFAVFLSAALLFGPLTVLERWVKSRRLRLLLLFLLVWWGVTARESPDTGMAVAILLNLISVPGLMAAFFLGDFLASIVFSAGYVFFFRLVDVAQIAPLLQRQDNWALLVALATLLVATVCAFRGRVAREEEVRPQYARDIQERLQLQSEAQAARHAQLRLLPASTPSLPGFQLAASCRPAEVVSGDFHDFFPMSGSRLGVFLADGGGNGLATALSIALAKGYLMHKAHSGLSPIEALRGLQTLLGQEIQEFRTEGFCFAVLDAQEGSIRYARLGETPGLLLAGADDLVSETVYPLTDEHKIVEGYCRLSPSSRAVLYTNGLARAAGEPDRASMDRWLLRRLSSSAGQPPDILLESILKRVFSRRAGFGKRRAKDDVTVIVLGLDRAGTMEQVA